MPSIALADYIIIKYVKKYLENEIIDLNEIKLNQVIAAAAELSSVFSLPLPTFRETILNLGLSQTTNRIDIHGLFYKLYFVQKKDILL